VRDKFKYIVALKPKRDITPIICQVRPPSTSEKIIIEYFFLLHLAKTTPNLRLVHVCAPSSCCQGPGGGRGSSAPSLGSSPAGTFALKHIALYVNSWFPSPHIMFYFTNLIFLLVANVQSGLLY